jgi:Domain of unknown function (DUF4272)
MSAEPNLEPNLDEAAKRRKRTNAYLSMWAIQADLTAVPVPVVSQITMPTREAVIGRAKAWALCSLKGQGLTQHEVFAFADAYEVWGHITITENDYILDPDPNPTINVNNAWRYEAVKVLEWTLGLVRHLGFPETPGDAAEVIKVCIEQLCAQVDPAIELRSVKELLDAADVARCLDAVAQVLAATGQPMPSGLNVGVTFERQLAFSWLTDPKTD